MARVRSGWMVAWSDFRFPGRSYARFERAETASRALNSASVNGKNSRCSGLGGVRM